MRGGSRPPGLNVLPKYTVRSGRARRAHWPSPSLGAIKTLADREWRTRGGPSLGPARLGLFSAGRAHSPRAKSLFIQLC